LLAAAAGLFKQRAWQGTRLEDVAQLAGVSTATAYNHFKSKQALMGHVYAPLARGLLEAASRDIECASPPVSAIRRHIYDLATLSRENRDLTVSLVAAMQEQTYKVGETPADPEDVRVLVPLAEPLSELIAYGQQVGALKSELAAADLGTYHTSALLFRVLSQPFESAHETASIALKQLLPALLTETERLTEWSPDADLTPVLKRLTASAGRGTDDERRRLANHPLTKEYLEAGFRLLTRECMPIDPNIDEGRQEDDQVSLYFTFLTSLGILDEVRRHGDKQVDENSLHDRWPHHDDYVIDILSYAIQVKDWWPHAIAADKSSGVIAGSTDIVRAAHEAGYQDQVMGLNDPAGPMTLIATAITERHPELRESMGARYRDIQRKWMLIYQQAFARYGVRLRSDVTIQNFADIISALSDGFVLRSRADANVDFIDHDKRQTLFGRAAIAVLIACIDTGDDLTLEDAFRKLFS
jgi:AcrR family transcriptional regulator